VEAPDPHPADARPQALSAWDASACAHPDAAADEAHRYLRRQRQREAVVEKLAGQVLDAQARDGKFRRLELQAAPGVELAALALCTLGAGQSVEQSCAELEAAEQPDALKQEPMAARSPRPQEALQQAEPVPQAAELRDAAEALQLATRKLAALRRAQEAQPRPAYRQRMAA
jgi:hypothetical protein